MAPETTGKKHFWRTMMGVPLALALIVGLVGIGLSFPLFSIPSASGVPNVLEGDLVLTRGFKFVCGTVRPKAGDLVVFRHKKFDYLKRLVGSPGDHIQFKSGVLVINGQPTSQKPEGGITLDLGGFKTKADLVRETLPNGRSYLISLVDRQAPPENTEEFVLPPKQYFFVGDSRDNSLDSRFSEENEGIGLVPEGNLCAVAVRILNSSDRTHVWKAL